MKKSLLSIFFLILTGCESKVPSSEKTTTLGYYIEFLYMPVYIDPCVNSERRSPFSYSFVSDRTNICENTNNISNENMFDSSGLYPYDKARVYFYDNLEFYSIEYIHTEHTLTECIYTYSIAEQNNEEVKIISVYKKDDEEIVNFSEIYDIIFKNDGYVYDLSTLDSNTPVTLYETKGLGGRSVKYFVEDGFFENK